MNHNLATRTLTLGTRASRLARWQTDHVAQLLQAAAPGISCRVVTFETRGDKTLDRPISQIGGKGLFTAELERALRSAEIDLAVHSLKDLPVDDAAGVTIGALCSRADAHDVLVSRQYRSLSALPHGASVGTSSPRRAAQLLAARPDLTVAPIRGNVDTRIRKAMQGDYDAIVLAAAGIQRLGLEETIADYLPFDMMLPAPGQGALAVQCREDDHAVRELLAMIDERSTRTATEAERSFLKHLGGGCSAPIAAYAESSQTVRLTGLVASLDGSRVIRLSETASSEDAATLGVRLAQQALAKGAGDLTG